MIVGTFLGDCTASDQARYFVMLSEIPNSSKALRDSIIEVMVDTREKNKNRAASCVKIEAPLPMNDKGVVQFYQ